VPGPSGPSWLLAAPSVLEVWSEMAPLHSFAATGAMADMNIELSMDGSAWNFSLILQFDLFENHIARCNAGKQRGSGAS